MRSQLSCSEGSLIFSFCPDHPHGVKIHDGQGLPWWFSGWDSILRLLESQVQSLVRAGELRSCLLHGMAKNQKKKKKDSWWSEWGQAPWQQSNADKNLFYAGRKSHTRYIGTHCCLLSGSCQVEATARTCRSKSTYYWHLAKSVDNTALFHWRPSLNVISFKSWKGCVHHQVQGPYLEAGHLRPN